MSRRFKIFILAAGVLAAPVLLSPLPRFRKPLATVVEASDSTLLGARIAADGQWRFPPSRVPVKFRTALIESEDRWFSYHPGINPVSIVRALSSNIRRGEIVSGGSTITMQVARMALGNRPRTYGNKIIEILSAIKLEIFRSKETIMEMYAANAPFGGNTVGLEAAAWRYTGKSSGDLSWAEAATLAILPNSPGLVYPGRNQELLKSKRDDLLMKLLRGNHIDSLTLLLSVDEPVPGLPGDLPSEAPHLTEYFYSTARGRVTVTTIDHTMQERATEIIENHRKELSANRINNAACIIIEVETGNVLAYVGNTNDGTKMHASDVDIIRSTRSTGSILKPFLYAGMQQTGEILPNSLVADIPTRFPGFSPKNFDLSFSGAVGASHALSQSLNVPSVRMLQEHGIDRFLELLQKAGFASLNRSADHYGLSLILGGGETTLWELAGSYASISRVLNHYLLNKKYYKGDYHQPVLVKGTISDTTIDLSPPLSASAIWLTYEALLKVNRPETEAGWQYFSSSPNIAWKTGTSFGFRDGWAVGTTPKHVIAVWTGNADGEGRPGLTGITTAAPILFDLINITGTGSWFDSPVEELTTIEVCSLSGYRAGPDCPGTTEIFAHMNGLRGEQCPYHLIVHLDRTGRRQVTSLCEDPGLIRNISWFVLPPAMEYFYRQRHPEYKILPPSAPGCDTDELPVMEFIYPTRGLKIFIPRDQTGKRTRIIAEVAHRNPSKKIFWHVDESFLTTTKSIHQVELFTQPGIHNLTAIDEDGKMEEIRFEIINE